ncbi:hypothetical protein [Methylobacterium sp. E-045]|uniref:hypothetical protein n=1 Tax=Methylobacterium sp. E-045 TaxID=2836575 RepID=UPI001FBC0752|nr:hypothetical protein [Methylobacterium sp. E-045]MCJ2131598.1 hypothetical protein [Methylobacterium sp. E-045]
MTTAIDRMKMRRDTLEVINRVAEHHELTLADMTGVNRSRAGTCARGHAIHELRNTLGIRMPEIARLFA